MFTEYKEISDLEAAYDEERRKLNDKLEQLQEIKHQIKLDCEYSYDCFLYLAVCQEVLKNFLNKFSWL
ncbi:TPA: hypothetical protein ACU3H3_001534 [Staphylococcus aureus]